jgi:hypothetical protein
MAWERLMNIVLGFTPYVAFFIVMRIGPVEAAMWAAFAVAVLLALHGRWRGRSAKLLEIGGVVLFGVLAVVTSVAHWNWNVTAVRLAVDLGLLAIVLISLAIGRPFTVQYARERVPEQQWQSPLFLSVNRRIAWVWAGAIAALVVAHAGVVATLVPVWIDALVTILAFSYAASFTARYPARARRAAGVENAV